MKSFKKYLIGIGVLLTLVFVGSYAYNQVGYKLAISDVEKIAYPVVESEHYPYPSSQSFALVYENTFEGAKSITLQISYQFYFSSSGIYIYNSSSASNYSYLTRFYGTQSSITDTTYTVNGNYVKIKFSSSTYTSTYANYYGYRIKVIPNYE